MNARLLRGLRWAPFGAALSVITANLAAGDLGRLLAGDWYYTAGVLIGEAIPGAFIAGLFGYLTAPKLN